MRANRRPGIVLERRRHGLDQRRAQRPARGGVARLGERHFVRAGERRGAEGRGVAFGVEQPVGAVFVVRLQQHDAEVAQDRAFGPGVEIAVAPQLANASGSPRPMRPSPPPRARRRACPRSTAAAPRRRIPPPPRGTADGRGVRPPAGSGHSPRPGQVGWALAKASSAREGRMRVGAQRRPFQREALVRIAGRRRERRERRRRRPSDRPAPPERPGRRLRRRRASARAAPGLRRERIRRDLRTNAGGSADATSPATERRPSSCATPRTRSASAAFREAAPIPRRTRAAISCASVSIGLSAAGGSDGAGDATRRAAIRARRDKT